MKIIKRAKYCHLEHNFFAEGKKIKNFPFIFLEKEAEFSHLAIIRDCVRKKGLKSHDSSIPTYIELL